MAEQSSSSDDYRQLARERMIWLVRPLWLMLLVIWVFEPQTVREEVRDENAMFAFLLGAGWVIYHYRKDFFKFARQRRERSIARRNRMPDEFYLGDIITTLKSG